MESSGQGWRDFAGIMIVIVGTLNVINGLVALANSAYLNNVENDRMVNLPITDDIRVWGWVVLIIGVLLILAGAAIFSGQTWGRVVGIVFAGGNILVQFTWIQALPFWSFTLIVIDILIIYALVVHGRDVSEPEAV